MKKAISLLLILSILIISLPCASAVSGQKIQVSFFGQKRTGTYNGKLQNNMPHGSGQFTSTDGLPLIEYDGDWSYGNPAGDGNLHAKAYYIHFGDPKGSYDRVGEYRGETVDGIPSGYGSYSSANASGTPWTYTGAFENGKFNGFGTIEWFGNKAIYHTGNYVDGIFTPTYAQFVFSYGYDCGFHPCPLSMDFIERNNNYFTSRSSGTPMSRDIVSWNLWDFKRDRSNYTQKFVELRDLTVEQVLRDDQLNRQYELVILSDADTLYYGFFDGWGNVSEGTRIRSIYVVPLEWGSYDNVDGDAMDAVFCAYSKVLNTSSNIQTYGDPYQSSGTCDDQDGYIMYAKQDCNVRSQPSKSDDNVIDRISKGTPIKVLERVRSLDGSSDWYKICYKGRIAYISISVTTDKKPPKAQPTTPPSSGPNNSGGSTGYPKRKKVVTVTHHGGGTD